MVKIISNTYPKYPNVPRAEIGDLCKWYLEKGAYRLKRISDNKTIFVSVDVDKNGLRRSNRLPPPLVGIIAEYKKMGWILEVTNIAE